jgi:hypothetical protein
MPLSELDERELRVVEDCAHREIEPRLRENAAGDSVPNRQR